jgi:hypothetical protein
MKTTDCPYIHPDNIKRDGRASENFENCVFSFPIKE